MTKEQTLELMKDLVLTLVRKSTELKTNKILQEKWVANKNKLEDNVKQISPEDTNWIDAEYKKWFENNTEVQKSFQEVKNKVGDSGMF